MSFVTQSSFSLFTHLIFFNFLAKSCSCFYPTVSNASRILTQSDNWSPAVATWYGGATSAGSDGGACGYGNAVGEPPFSSLVSAGGPSLFNSSKGCGACYQVKCTERKECSGKAVRVVMTDECPGGACATDGVHFDLSGSAVGAMALSGNADQLRSAGIFPIQYHRVQCNYPGTTLTFEVDNGSNPNYFAAVIKYVAGDGDLARVDLKQALDSDSWLPMQQSWGAVWKLDAGVTLRAPFSIKLTSGSGKVVVADNVIPAGWVAGKTYPSVINF